MAENGFRQTAQVVSDETHLTQDTRCPQGRKATPISSLKHILHALASSSLFGDLEGSSDVAVSLFSSTVEGTAPAELQAQTIFFKKGILEIFLRQEATNMTSLLINTFKYLGGVDDVDCTLCCKMLEYSLGIAKALISC